MAKAKTRTPAAAPAPLAASTSEYTVVARRYRPQQFAELVGQEHVARALKNAIESDRVAHAYLFTGARGTGKTSTARILAKALNCVKGPTATPCDQCEICRSIIGGEDIDVIEIDGASNRGIENIRELRQNVGTRPSRARYKIYIIDEVHMLSKDAFNALLKTLEEPPPHVKFIFATTEVNKIPITILSRCQRFDFAGITSSRIADRLRQVVAAEGMQADDDALAIVARRAGGSMRDAQSLLDQLLAFSGDRLTVERVHQLLGTASDDRILTLVDAILARDAKLALETLNRFAEEGLQLGELLDQIISWWRSLMVLNSTGGEFADLELAEAQRARAAAQAKSLSLDTILAGLDVLTTTKTRLRASGHALVLLEMAVLRLIRLDDLIPISQLAQDLSRPGTMTAARPTAAAETAKKNSLVERATPVSNPAADVPADEPAKFWPEVMKQFGPMLAGSLNVAGLPAISGPKSLVFRFGAGYNHQHEFCTDPNSILQIQNALKTATGAEWQVRMELEAATDVQSGGRQSTEPDAGESVAQSAPSAIDNELVRIAKDKLSARVMHVDPGFGQTDDSLIELPEPQES